MTSELRYHVITLCAVFLALGIGILIGTTFVGSRIVDRQSGLIARLDSRVETLRRDAVQYGRVTEMLAELVPDLNGQSLPNDRVVVVDVADDPGTAGLLMEQLVAAGAKVDRLSLPKDRWSGESEADAVAARLGYALVRGEDIDSLRDRGLIEGGARGRYGKMVIVTGINNPTTRPDQITGLWKRLEECPRAFHDSGGIVVVVERTDNSASVLPSARRSGFPTIDCADHPAGWITLIRLLKSSKSKDPIAYGLRDDASRRLPRAN